MLMNRAETALINSPPRRWLQRLYEVPVLLRFGGRLLPGSRALEIGCGSGYGSQLVLQRFGAERIDALDLDPAMIHRARERLASYGDRVNLVQGSATDLRAALNADDGTPKWSVALGYQPQTPPSLSPDGAIVAGGGPGARLTGVRDDGDRGEITWTRDDVAPLTTASQAGGGVGYTVTRAPDGMALLLFDASNGSTIKAYPMRNAQGHPLGVSIGHDRRVIAATSDGRVYAFAPA